MVTGPLSSFSQSAAGNRAASCASPKWLGGWGGTRVGFTATGEINRQDFGVTWNAAIEAGGVAISDKVVIHLEIEAVLQA